MTGNKERKTVLNVFLLMQCSFKLILTALLGSTLGRQEIH